LQNFPLIHIVNLNKDEYWIKMAREDKIQQTLSTVQLHWLTNQIMLSINVQFQYHLQKNKRGCFILLIH